jgi:hypothetical protein
MHVLARTLEVETSPSVAVQLDGDPFGNTPTAVTIAPGTLRLLAPPQFQEPVQQTPGASVVKKRGIEALARRLD